MDSIYEINMSNVRRDVDTGRIVNGDKAKIVEVFSALAQGKDPDVDNATKDKCVKTLRDMGSRALSGDQTAESEINSVIRFTIEPKLLEVVKLYDFLGSFKRIGYNETPKMKTYNYESVDSRFQAASGDVTFAGVNWREYPIATQCISGGFSVDYREVQNGNFDGSIREGMQQVQTDMQNKASYYILTTLYKAIKDAKGVKHFAENHGVTKTAVDAMLKTMRRYGKVNIAGDYSVVSQLNDFAGFKQADSSAVRYGTDAIADEIMRNGILGRYNGAVVTELPNAINWTHLNKEGTDYALYMPEGFMWFLPRGVISPLQTFLRGGLTSMTGDDVVTRQHMTRFDMEFGAGVAEGMEDQIGLISDLNFEAPQIA